MANFFEQDVRKLGELRVGENTIRVRAVATGLTDSDEVSVPYDANGRLSYEPIDAAHCKITGKGSVELLDIIIPKTITTSENTTLTVVAIEERAFEGAEITSVTIPNTIKSIGNNAFDGSDLTSVTFENEDITVYLRNTEKWQNPKCIFYCPDEQDESGNNASTTKAMSYVEKDGGYDIYSVVLPANTGALYFEGTISGTNKTDSTLMGITVDIKNNNCYEIIWNGYSSARLCDYVPDKIDKFTLTIGESAFANCQSLLTVKLPNTIKQVPERMFWGCNDLHTVEFPLTTMVTEIGEWAFGYCYSLKNINLRHPLQVIGEAAFQVTGLDSIGICADRIESGAFSRCYNLTEVKWHKSPTFIGRGAFSYCTELQRIDIPKEVEWIGKEAFIECTKLTQVEFADYYGWFWNDLDDTTNGHYYPNLFHGSAAIAARSLTDDYTNDNLYKIFQVPTPTITLIGSMLNITDESGVAEMFSIYVNEETDWRVQVRPGPLASGASLDETEE